MTSRSAVLRRRPITTLALAGLLALALSACATAPSAITWGEAAGPQTFDLKQASLVTTVAPSYALARFGPPGPRATAVQQSLEAENVTQTVLLVGEAATPGQNALNIVLREGGRLERPSLRAITAETAKAFPVLRLAIADRATSNRYGPYGLAYGRSSGVGCGYAWQQVDGQERATGILPGRRYRLDIRLRFCGANLAENDVVTMMDGIRLSSLTRAELARAEAFSPPQTAIVGAEAPAYAPTAAPKPSVRAAAKPARLAVKAPEVAPAVTRTADFPMPPA